MMYGTVNKINDTNWAYWTLEKIRIDSDDIIISIRNDNSNSVRFHLRNFIGISCVGHWDESTIKDIKVQSKGKLLDDSIETVKKQTGLNLLKGRRDGESEIDWVQIKIDLVYGSPIEFACYEIEMS